ncbi:MAG: hypothetical protein KKE23_01535 [Nanoarchaeota archaeon]|nr:hypothetical protein [Nanoarchaeota archaeon]
MAKKVVKKNVRVPCGNGWPMLIVGALVLANAYWPIVSWPVFIGWLAVICGLSKMIVPCK